MVQIEGAVPEKAEFYCRIVVGMQGNPVGGNACFDVSRFDVADRVLLAGKQGADSAARLARRKTSWRWRRSGSAWCRAIRNRKYRVGLFFFEK